MPENDVVSVIQFDIRLKWERDTTNGKGTD